MNVPPIRQVQTPEDAQAVFGFIKQFPLNYPDYESWLEKCKEELKIGSKHAFYVIGSKEPVVGSIVFQQHRLESQVLELKNLRVNPKNVRQTIGSWLEFLAEFYAKHNGYKRIQCDAHPENPVVSFMESRGYRIEAHETLYTAKAEVILIKDI